MLFRRAAAVIGLDNTILSSAVCSTKEEVICVRSRSVPSGAERSSTSIYFGLSGTIHSSFTPFSPFFNTFTGASYRRVTMEETVSSGLFNWYRRRGAQMPIVRHRISTQANKRLRFLILRITLPKSMVDSSESERFTTS